MPRKLFIRLGLVIITLIACARFTPMMTPTPVPTPTIMPSAAPMPKPTYALGLFWKDITGKDHYFVNVDPPSANFMIDFDRSMTYKIPGTEQTLTVVQYGMTRDNILIGVWTYFFQNDTNVLGDISIVAVADDGTELRDLKVKVEGQEVGTFATQQITLPKDVMGKNISIEPVGLLCKPIYSNPMGAMYETDGLSIVIAFLCQPIRNPQA